jgi:hypothetical protein
MRWSAGKSFKPAARLRASPPAGEGSGGESAFRVTNHAQDRPSRSSVIKFVRSLIDRRHPNRK